MFKNKGLSIKDFQGNLFRYSKCENLKRKMWTVYNTYLNQYVKMFEVASKEGGCYE